jgi:hypothetical protein
MRPMRLFVTADLTPPARTRTPDGAGARAGAAPLHDVLSRAVQAIASDGTVVTVVDQRVGSHPDGILAWA